MRELVEVKAREPACVGVDPTSQPSLLAFHEVNEPAQSTDRDRTDQRKNYE